VRYVRGGEIVSMIDRYRHRRQIARQHRALQRALDSTTSPAVRDEIRAIAQRHYG
jgi:hypothetical protein